MRAAGPAARPPHPFFELRAHPFDMLPPCLIFLDGDGPADPLVARERRYVFPCRPCLRVGRERLSEISRKVMYNSFGDSNNCHSVISPCVSLLARSFGRVSPFIARLIHSCHQGAEFGLKFSDFLAIPPSPSCLNRIGDSNSAEEVSRLQP